jgi:DNA-binding transcriptional LysR family regulator
MIGPGRDLNLLIALRALLEEANVTRAGDRINMSQSSMSSALSRLRLQFNDELLVRVGRDYELTPMGQLLLPQLQRTLPLIERALRSEGNFDPATSTRNFRLMLTDYSATELKPILALALEVAPNVSFDIVGLPSEPTDSARDLTINDFVVTVPGVGVAGDHYKLFTDDYVCLVDRNNKHLVDGKLSWDGFLEAEKAVCKFGRAHLLPPERRLSEMGYQLKPHVVTNSYLPLAHVVAGTDLVAITPRRVAKRLPLDSPVIVVEPPFGEVDANLTLWWHPSHNSDPAHVWIREFIIGHSALLQLAA